MKPSRLALLALVTGAWLAISGATIAGAVISFGEAPSASAAESGDAAAIGGRAQAMRFNAKMFRASARFQLVLAGMAVLLAAWAPIPSRAGIACVLAAALLATALALVVVPRSATLAEQRLATLHGGPAPSPEEDERFRALHRAYGALDLGKSLLLVGGLFAVTRAASRAR